MRIVRVQPAGLSGYLDSWRDDLLGRGCKPHSIERMAGIIKACTHACAWGSPADVDYQGAVRWLASKRENWKPATTNQAISTLRGFGAHLQRCGALPTNPLQALQSVKGQGDPGSRAETPEAIRRLLEAAIAAHMTDRRRKGCAPFYWLFLATTGLRYNEARSIRWCDLDLDEGLLTTAPEWSKAKRRDVLPIYPPLLDMLRDWRALSDDATRKVASRTNKTQNATFGVASRVFPIVPNHVTFRQHRDAAGIPAVDGRRRPFTPHGLRKSFSTWLDQAGCPAGIRSMLVRHATTLTEQTYTDPPLADLRHWIAQLPNPWPEGVRVFPKISTEKEKSRETVARAKKIRYIPSATMGTTHQITASGPAALPPIVANAAGRSGQTLLTRAAKSRANQHVERCNGQGLTQTTESLNDEVAAVLTRWLAQRLAQESHRDDDRQAS